MGSDPRRQKQKLRKNGLMNDKGIEGDPNITNCFFPEPGETMGAETANDTWERGPRAMAPNKFLPCFIGYALLYVFFCWRGVMDWDWVGVG